MDKRQRPRMQIIRGLPGSGKTTLAVKRYSHLMRIETDMYFNRRGAYRFTLETNRRAVEWFQDEVENMCASGLDFVVTGVLAAHTERLDEVIETGILYGYDIYIKTLTSQHKTIHGVPERHLDGMRKSFTPEKELRKRYEKNKQVHFGLMPTKYPLAHLIKQQKGKQS